ncbi:hypothetical protein ACA910_012958 [Epithemia clementina (nom. ined.)]
MSSDDGNNQQEDALMAPIPRKKRANQGSSNTASNAAASSAQRDDITSSNISIPRKSGGKKPSSIQRDRVHANPKKKEKRSYGRSSSQLVSMVSESPMIVKIKIAADSLPRQQRSTQRPHAKRIRPLYQEMDLTDSDDFMSEDEAPPKKKGRLQPFSAITTTTTTTTSSKSNGKGSGENTDPEAPSEAPLPLDPDDMMIATDSTGPPEGTLSTLWYSREFFAQVFVMEKILGFKTRPVLKLKQTTATTTSSSATEAATTTTITTTPTTTEDMGSPQESENFQLDSTTATHLQQALIQDEAIWADTLGRMEVSRLVPGQCPAVQIAAALREERMARREGRQPKFHISPQEQQQVEEEEVLLVKWRGRSYMHCSWERSNDIQRLDTSNNSTSRNKIRRYYQAQETSLGPEWKKLLKTQGAQEPNAENTEGEEYFPVQFLEMERILSCDETEMNLDVLAKQRGRNLRREQQILERRDKAGTPIHDPSNALLHAKSDEKDSAVIPDVYEPFKKLLEEQASVLDAASLNPDDIPWDPEDNVRYVVKWKGLPYAEITWEYWRDIKLDAVHLVEDYWYRQKAPVNYQSKPHPHIRDFKKLQESPLFGVSERIRPCMGYDEFEKEEDVFKGFKLRSYQLEGVNWLLFNWWNKRSCILADEMGLGKTIQSTAFLRELQTNVNTKIRGPFLIVAPLSLAGQWQSELASWAPDMNVVLYHGSADARDFLVQQEFFFNEPFVNKGTAAKLKKQHTTKFHVLITTYEVVLKDSSVLSKIRWRVLIVDEAHRLKNHKSRLFDELAAVQRDHCVLLTGTPIANATEELWALLHFANPQAFSDREEFLSKFGEMTDAQQVNDLHSLLRPFLLRRVKEDVEKSLPPKEETILEVSLTPIQKTFYKAIYERNTAFLFKGAKPSNAPSLMNVMMELRKCCNHPFLVKGAEDRILSDAAVKMKEKNGDSTAVVDYGKLFGEQLVKSSGKMVLIEKLLQKLFAGGHKVLIFSQMVKVLDLLEELLKLKKYRYERLDGSTSSSSRAASVDRFTRKSFQRFVMLLSTRAGGLGLNLTAADVVIIFDSDWNPQNDLQAMARAHRIGQERRVMIYRLLTAKTYEMHMFHSASLKLGLERAVLSQNREQGDETDDKSNKKKDKDAQAKEIDELLKKGAYDVFRDDDDEDAEKFMETDIDQLLAHSSKKVTYGASATSSLGSGLGSFSKASFVADTDDGAKDVDLDDPDFWSKAVGLDAPVETSEELAAMLDAGVKRNRKQVQVYDPYAETAEAEMRKKEKLALEKLLEKEEKERQRLEKKAKKEAAKEKKKKEREEQQKLKEQVAKQTAASKVVKEDVQKKATAEVKPAKKSKKSDRQRALRRAENENPALEQLKQAWEVSHRNRASAAVLRFGFRFCKVRHESGLMSLPLQDLELFARSYVYQIALQAGVSLFSLVTNVVDGDQVRHLVEEWIGTICCQSELYFIFDSISTVMEVHDKVERYERFLRMPVILAEPVFVSDLRCGGAFRALRRIWVLSQLNSFIEMILDEILTGLGHEELGKRGCANGDLSCLDVDLKARFVTTEELTLSIGTRFGQFAGTNPSALWWDRECDVGLILGTFIHGLGNYRAMGFDPDLCFPGKIKYFSESYTACKMGMNNFNIACKAARKIFDDALEAGRMKAELEVQAAVAAAAKAAKEREEDAAVLREGGEGVEAAIKNMPKTQVENAFEFDGTDSHFVTLERMQKFVRGALISSQSSIEYLEADDAVDAFDEPTGRGRHRDHIPMPDARILDYRLLALLRQIEEGYPHANGNKHEVDSRSKPQTIVINTEVRSEVLLSTIGTEFSEWIHEFSGVGLGSYQCGTTHRTLNDGSDYSHGSASPQLAQVAYGTDAPRYLRQIGVPMNLTRYAVCALVHVDSGCVEELLKGESLKYYGSEKGRRDRKESQDAEPKSSPDEAKVESSETVPVPASPKLVVGDEKASRIPNEFRRNSKLRAVVCMTVLVYGYSSRKSGTVNSSLLSLLNIDTRKDSFFDSGSFRSSVVAHCSGMEVPSESVLNDYVEQFLIPHCLQLCLYGNGPLTRDARGSQGEYETALGVSLHADPSRPHPSPIPDPCLPLREHGTEALCHASALLRRVQLLRACQYVCACEDFSVDVVERSAKTKQMGDLHELPVWWCPWIHDIALVVNAATEGIFSIISTRSVHPIFAPGPIEDFLRMSLPPTRSGALPGSLNTSQEKTDEWIRRESERFPVMRSIERRLSFFCDLVTSKASDSSVRYCNLPMFDHGGWPRL